MSIDVYCEEGPRFEAPSPVDVSLALSVCLPSRKWVPGVILGYGTTRKGTSHTNSQLCGPVWYFSNKVPPPKARFEYGALFYFTCSNLTLRLQMKVLLCKSILTLQMKRNEASLFSAILTQTSRRLDSTTYKISTSVRNHVISRF